MENVLLNPSGRSVSTSTSSRLTSIDALRGLIIVLMALDHVRDFWSATPYRADDVTQTSVILFMTRWVTHFCAPIFVFLTGVSTFLYQQKQPGKQPVSVFLLTRGAWMIFLEFAVVGFFWQFSYDVIFLQVIWVIGWSMLCLAGLIWLPRWLLLSLAIVLVAGHQLLIHIEPEQMTADHLGWIFLHRPVQFLTLGNGLPPLFAVYPLIPWVGVMIAGYVAGSMFTMESTLRKQRFLLIGLAMIVFFVALRATNLYGDPKPWAVQERGLVYTILSFFSISKYPPSLLYISLTLGVAFLLLSAFEGLHNRFTKILIVFGNVPLFFYLIHIPIINASASVWTYLAFGHPVNLFFSSSKSWPATYEPNLGRLYLVWGVLIICLYFLCRWYGAYKRSHSAWWLKYL